VVTAWGSLYIWWLGMGSSVECGGWVCVASVRCDFGYGEKKKKIIIILLYYNRMYYKIKSVI
jgi:hypothetical protein